MGQKRNFVVFESRNIFETGESTPTKIGVHKLESIPTCMNFLSRFRKIKFFDDHGTIVHAPKGKFHRF